MPKNDHKHVINLYESIGCHAGHTAAEEFYEKLPLSRSADFKKKSEWSRDVCDYLEERFSEDEIKRIRMDCSCNPGRKAEKARKLSEASADCDVFCERYNKAFSPGNTLSFDGEAFYLSYPRCYCSNMHCVQRAGGQVSRSWCLCSLGFAEKLFSHAFGRDVTVELVESVMTGGERCVMRIT